MCLGVDFAERVEVPPVFVFFGNESGVPTLVDVRLQAIASLAPQFIVRRMQVTEDRFTVRNNRSVVSERMER